MIKKILQRIICIILLCIIIFIINIPIGIIIKDEVFAPWKTLDKLPKEPVDVLAVDYVKTIDGSIYHWEWDKILYRNHWRMLEKDENISTPNDRNLYECSLSPIIINLRKYKINCNVEYGGDSHYSVLSITGITNNGVIVEWWHSTITDNLIDDFLINLMITIYFGILVFILIICRDILLYLRRRSKKLSPNNGM
jgi:hypothetical protein